MSAREDRGAGLMRQVRKTAEVLGVRAVLLAYWGTAALLARCTQPSVRAGESVRRQA
ncbi:hypothetical protein ACFVXE_27265 [Streptomyces sp. NPDC058231]|uniref:hypothetical protein n=1 Tax=Streptomyces sp. NPDC058231 TaxID=3346392 RepID=UPI0036E037D0